MHLTSKAGSMRYSGKTVPEESGAWGWLLPVGGAPRKETPAAHGTVVEISPACLRLQTPSDALRGFAAVGAYALGVWMAFGAVFFMVKFDASTRGYDSFDFILVSALSIALALVGLISGFKLTFSKVFDSVIFSRRLRRIYYWEKKGGWKSVDYDRATPFVPKLRMTTTTGSNVLYPLRVVEFLPGTRRVNTGVSPTVPFAQPQSAAQLWEFIRCYMDQYPAALPPVALLPDHRANAYAWMDRELFSQSVDRQHHLKGTFGALSFWFFACVYYAPNWVEYWIRRRGNRPALPPELADTLAWEGENPYRIIPPSPVEQLAIEGRLPHMMKRWRAVSAVGLFIWAVLPVSCMVAFVLFT